MSLTRQLRAWILYLRALVSFNLCEHWVTRRDFVIQSPVPDSNRLSDVEEETFMYKYMNSRWGAADDSDTDAADAADLVSQPEWTDEHKRVHIQVPEILGKQKKLNQLKTELRRKFNVNTIEESKRPDMISVSGYGFDRNDVLRVVRRYDSRAT